jgi:hypothetical protein
MLTLPARHIYQDVYKLLNFEPDTPEPLKALYTSFANAMFTPGALRYAITYYSGYPSLMWTVLQRQG